MKDLKAVCEAYELHLIEQAIEQGQNDAWVASQMVAFKSWVYAGRVPEKIALQWIALKSFETILAEYQSGEPFLFASEKAAEQARFEQEQEACKQQEAAKKARRQQAVQRGAMALSASVAPFQLKDHQVSFLDEKAVTKVKAAGGSVRDSRLGLAYMVDFPEGTVRFHQWNKTYIELPTGEWVDIQSGVSTGDSLVNAEKSEQWRNKA